MTALAFTAALASLLCLVLAVHPFITYPLALRALARLRPRPLVAAPNVPAPSIAVCVCAYNEEKVIAARLQNLIGLRAAHPDLHILVYVDGASDRTADIVRGFGEQISAIISTERAGKTHGMNRLVRLATADIIAFSDANVAFAPDALEKLSAPFADPSVGCVCGHLRYTGGEGQTAATGSLYWRLEETIKALESATGSVMGADGSIFAMRRALYTPAPPHLIDDMFVSLSLLCQGGRIVRAADAYAYEASVATPHEEFRRKIRIACQAFNVHRALWPALRRLPPLDLFKYVSHKLLRWLTMFSLLAALLFAALALALAGCWATFAIAVICAASLAIALLTVSSGPLAKLREILAAFLATGLGVLRSLRGEKFQTWTPPSSARAITAQPGQI